MRISQFLGVVYSPDWANHVGGAGDAVDTRFGTKAAGSSDRSREPERSTCSRAACTSALLRRAVRGGERSLLRVRHPPEEREVRMREPARVPRRGSRRHRTPEARRGSAAPGLHRTGAEPRGVARADRADGLGLGQRLAEDDGTDTDGLQVPFEDVGFAARSGERDLCVEDGCGGPQPAVLGALDGPRVTKACDRGLPPGFSEYESSRPWNARLRVRGHDPQVWHLGRLPFRGETGARPSRGCPGPLIASAPPYLQATAFWIREHSADCADTPRADRVGRLSAAFCRRVMICANGRPRGT